jgi:protein-S-isoprenylcysteine O-methyltransferase Ste14
VSIAGFAWFALWFFGAFPAAILRLAGASLVPERGAALWIAAAIAALGIVAVFRESLRFVVRGRGTLVPIEPPRKLVIEGPYRCVRNPMYLVYVAIALAEALAYRSVWLVGYAALLFGIAHAYVVLREEPLLRARFGDAYVDYQKRVSRWWPRRSLPLDV